jgi:hypothetical protein
MYTGLYGKMVKSNLYRNSYDTGVREETSTHVWTNGRSEHVVTFKSKSNGQQHVRQHVFTVSQQA